MLSSQESCPKQRARDDARPSMVKLTNQIVEKLWHLNSKTSPPWSRMGPSHRGISNLPSRYGEVKMGELEVLGTKLKASPQTLWKVETF